VIRKYGVFGIADLAFGHVTAGAIVLRLASSFQILLAG